MTGPAWTPDWRRSAIVAAALVVHCGIVLACFQLIGPAAASVSVITAVTIGALLGQRAGAAAGLALVPLNVALFRAGGAELPLVSGHVVPGLLTTLVAAVVGRLRDLGVVLRAQRTEASRVRDELRTILESIPDAIVMSRRDGTIVFMNRLAEAMFCTATGAPSAARSVSELVVPEDLPILERRRRALAEGHHPGTDRVRAILGGRPRECEIRGSRVDYDGQPAIVTVLRDVTERQELERKLALTDRLASLGRLAAGVAHEINNPLSYTLSNVRYVRDVMVEHGPELPWLEEATQVLDEALGGAGQVRRIVQDLLAFARPRDQVCAIDVHRVLDLAANIASSQFLNRAALVKDYAQVGLVVGDESRLGQLALNLLLNAAQSVPEGRPSENEVRVVTRMHGATHVAIEISDTGAGIPDDAREHLFEPFFTTKPTGAGTGLGLSICYGIVTSLGGEISVESEVGKGSRFRVLLPASEPAGTCSGARA